MSWRGLPFALRDRAARELRSYPKLSGFLKRALGKLGAVKPGEHDRLRLGGVAHGSDRVCASPHGVDRRSYQHRIGGDKRCDRDYVRLVRTAGSAQLVGQRGPVRSDRRERPLAARRPPPGYPRRRWRWGCSPCRPASP